MTIAVRRLRQGLRALAALTFALPVDDQLARQTLTAGELAYFRRMKRSERLHSLRVLNAILDQAPHTPPALATAALMHDVGKTCYPVGLIGKSIPVLVKALAPALLNRLSKADPHNRLLRPFVTYRHHPEWSGEILCELGSSPDAIWLAAHHADPPNQWRDHPLAPLLERLQRADDAN